MTFCLFYAHTRYCTKRKVRLAFVINLKMTKKLNNAIHRNPYQFDAYATGQTIVNVLYSIVYLSSISVGFCMRFIESDGVVLWDGLGYRNAQGTADKSELIEGCRCVLCI